MKYARSWNNLGSLLKQHLERYAEAEAAYRKAIELDERMPGRGATSATC
jgi:Flp pilus assembly protein TadD